MDFCYVGSFIKLATCKVKKCLKTINMKLGPSRKEFIANALKVRLVTGRNCFKC